MPEQEYQNACGMTAEQIAKQLRKRFYEMYDLLREADPDRLQSIFAREWNEIPAAARARWTVAVEVLFEKQAAGVQSMSASLATQEFADCIVGAGHYRRQVRPLQLVWEAVLRHAIDLLTIGQVEGVTLNQSEIERELQTAFSYNSWKWVQEKYLAEKGVNLKHGRQTVPDAAD